MTALVRQFRFFLRDEVNPNIDRVRRLRSGIRGVRDHLHRNLDGFQGIARQGSLGLDTLIKPVREDDEYDADVQVVMNPQANWNPRQYLDAVFETLSTSLDYQDKLECNTRSVTIKFAGHFSMDVVPRITQDGQHQVCNRRDNRFESTDGMGYHNWFHEKSKLTNVNLKRAVRLLKYIRDRESNYKAPSILLTTLAANAIQSGDRGRDSVKSVASTLTTILTRMDSYLQGLPRKPAVRNPVLRSETFDRHWNDVQFAIYRENIHRYAEIATGAFASSSVPESIDRWRRLFGEGFGGHYKAPPHSKQRV